MERQLCYHLKNLSLSGSCNTNRLLLYDTVFRFIHQKYSTFLSLTCISFESDYYFLFLLFLQNFSVFDYLRKVKSIIFYQYSKIVVFIFLLLNTPYSINSLMIILLHPRHITIPFQAIKKEPRDYFYSAQELFQELLDKVSATLLSSCGNSNDI